MGTDIHLHIEYKHPQYGMQSIEDVGIGRDYELFTALAGIQNYDDRPVLYPPRGFPGDVSTFVLSRYYSRIIPDDAGDDLKLGVKWWCYDSDALEYAEKYGVEIVNIYGTRLIANNAVHSPSYLDRLEILQSLDYSGYNQGEAPIEFLMLMDILTAIDNRYGCDTSRIVFWFDN